MPFCGDCGRYLAYGEVCGCTRTNGIESPELHDYVCQYCGANVPAGEICTCPKAQFEARFVRTRPQQTNTSKPDASPYTYRPPAAGESPPPVQHTTTIPPQYRGYTPPVRKQGRSAAVTALAVVTVMLISHIFTIVGKFNRNAKASSSTGIVQDTAVRRAKEKASASAGSGGQDEAGGTIAFPDSPLPSSFSLADEGLLPEKIESQGEYGSCFAFSWIGIFQNRLLAQGIDADLSEWAFYKSFKEYYYNANRTNDIASMANLHTAVVPESEAPYPPDYSDYDIDPDLEKDSEYMVSDVYLLSGVGKNDRDEVSRKAKEFIRDGYALICSVYYDDGEEKYTDNFSGAWYVYDNVHSSSLALNHSVLVVGWDDNYSRDNFIVAPPHDGAWLVRNSWGVYSGDYGYYWISYDDKMFMYSELAAADIADADLCDTVQSNWVYGWDYSYYNSHSNTAVDGKPMDKVYQAVKYTAEEDMDITAVSFFTVCDDINYRVYVTTKDEDYIYYDSPDARGTQRACGYHMVETSSHKHVKKGEEYTVIVIMESPVKDYLIVQDSEYAFDRQRAYAPDAGTCYVSADGDEWIDVKSYSLKNADGEPIIMPLCINAYGKT